MNVKNMVDTQIKRYDLPFECFEAVIKNNHLELVIIEHLKGYGNFKAKDKIKNGEGDGKSFVFDEPLSREESVCLPYLVKAGSHYPTCYFNGVYKRKDEVPYNTATISIIKEYD